MKPLVIRDAVHDLIRIECPHAKALIATEPFQRLRRIKQLGLANLVYPGAEHSRFSHSLGVYFLAQEAMRTINWNQAEQKWGAAFDDKQKLLVGLMALLHDTGHGPYSHLFERVAKEALRNSKTKADKHEDWTKKIIATHPEVSEVLRRAEEDYDQGLSEDMCRILEGTYEPVYILDMLSSQMDMDRFDYLLRDSRNAGCQYGHFDYRWIFRTLLVGEMPDPSDGGKQHKVLASHEEKGRNCIEQYLLGRYFMYKHLYYHKTIVSAESMLKSLLLRAVQLLREKRLDPESYPVLRDYAEGKNPSLEDYLQLDDVVVSGWVGSWAFGTQDPERTLHRLARMLLRRELFVYHLPPTPMTPEYDEKKADIASVLQSLDFDPQHFFIEVSIPYQAHKQIDIDKFSDVRFVDPKTQKIRPLSMIEGSVVTAGRPALKGSFAGWFIPRDRELLDKLNIAPGDHSLN